jgi:hypothetical protein
MKTICLLLAILFPLFFALRNSEQLKELNAPTTHTREQHSRRWHSYQLVIQLLFATVVALTQVGWFFMLFGFVMTGAWFWLVFDVALNLFSNRSGLYLSDNGIDRILKRIGEGPALVIKIILVLIGTTWFFKNPFQ